MPTTTVPELEIVRAAARELPERRREAAQLREDADRLRAFLTASQASWREQDAELRSQNRAEAENILRSRPSGDWWRRVGRSIAGAFATRRERDDALYAEVERIGPEILREADAKAAEAKAAEEHAERAAAWLEIARGRREVSAVLTEVGATVERTERLVGGLGALFDLPPLPVLLVPCAPMLGNLGEAHLYNSVRCPGVAERAAAIYAALED